MAEPSDISEGYLVIADITGFTHYLADAELDHASAVMRRVLDGLTRSLVPPARLAEVEGDAVFVYLGAETGARRELVAELVEGTYNEFRDLRATMVRNANCPCRACRAIPELDLKFVVHWGRYVLEQLADRIKPVGSDVNLAHRLLKNQVAKNTGWCAYALYTRDAARHIGLDETVLHTGTESYEHLGEVPLVAEDLAQRYEAMRTQRRVLIESADAHAEIAHHFDLPRTLLWDWLNDPDKRNRWMDRAAWSAQARPGGRNGAGAENHCSSFKVIEQIVDYRPFDYYTVRFVASWVQVLATVVLTPRVEGTQLAWRMQVETPMPRPVKVVLARMMINQRMRLPKGFRQLQALAEA